jgi:hypothetical protein
VQNPVRLPVYTRLSYAHATLYRAGNWAGFYRRYVSSVRMGERMDIFKNTGKLLSTAALVVVGLFILFHLLKGLALMKFLQ